MGAVVLALAALGYGVFRLWPQARPPIVLDESSTSRSDAAIEPPAEAHLAETAAAPDVPREAIGDGAEVGTTIPPGFQDRRITVPSADDTGSVDGRALREAMLEHADVKLRFRTQADKDAFLSSRFVVNAPAYLPRGGARGVDVGEFVESIRFEGFEIEYRPPLIRIGPRRDRSPVGPR